MKTKEEILEKHYRNYKKRIAYDKNVLAAMEEYAQEVVKNNAILPNVSGNASERYRKALGYIREYTFEPGIGIEKASYVLEKALRIASGYNVD